MEYSLPLATWLLLLIPMPLLVVLSFVSYIGSKLKGE